MLILDCFILCFDEFCKKHPQVPIPFFMKKEQTLDASGGSFWRAVLTINSDSLLNTLRERPLRDFWKGQRGKSGVFVTQNYHFRRTAEITQKLYFGCLEGNLGRLLCSILVLKSTEKR